MTLHSREPQDDGVPLEALSDAIARVDANGTLHPCNGRMRELLAELSVAAGAPITKLEQLLPDDAGENESVASNGRLHSCRVVEHNDSRWLLATELGGTAGALAAELAVGRLRALGGLAGSIVHDLANLLLAGVAVAESVKPYVRDESEAKALEDLKAGARQGSVLGRALASQLNRSPRDWVTVPVQLLVEDVVAIVRKNAAGRGISVVVSNDVKGTVRVLFDEAVQALMHGLLFCLEGGARKISVSGHVEMLALAEGRERSVARIRIAASPVAETAARLARQILIGDQGLLDALNRAPMDASGLAHARLAVARVGGEMSVDHEANSIVLDYAWPTARADRPATGYR